MAKPHTIQSKKALVAALEAAQWVVSHAAAALGMSRQGLYKTMRHYGVTRRRAIPAELRQERARRAGSAPRKARAAA